jgi:DNA-binding NtrC family response regulator
VRIDCSLSSESNFREGLLGQNGEGGAWVKQAKGGTLFLQHLQCLTGPVQKELVSVLRNTAHGFRLVCTTTEDLEKLSDEGKFHDELFYRVASLPVHMPALRERPDDIPLLVKHYSSHAANPLFDANLIEFSTDALAVMTAYHWPGNLTELTQVVSKIAAATETRVITSQQLPLRLRELKHWPALAEYLAGQEKQYIDMVLHACRNDKAQAAKVLGVDAAKLA